MNDRRPKIPLHLAFPEEERSEIPGASTEVTESFAAKRGAEHTALPERLMATICATNNLVTALRRVKSNSHLNGWLGYFGRRETPSVLRDVNSWLHRRLRAVG